MWNYRGFKITTETDSFGDPVNKIYRGGKLVTTLYDSTDADVEYLIDRDLSKRSYASNKSINNKTNRAMKSLKSASILKGAKRVWKGKNKNGNTVHLYTKKGVAGIRVTSYRTTRYGGGRRALVQIKRVYRLGK